jgi:alpha-ketoglutarate-dependent 2,4-dichlorophenoxyacetate dioxygenase
LVDKEIAMAISVMQLHQDFAGEVSGVDLRNPLERDNFLEISEALDRCAVLAFRDQHLTDEQQLAFTQHFGPLETSIGTIRKDRKLRLQSNTLADISNLDENNNIRSTSDRWRMMMLANQLWHTDSSFKRVPGKVSFLSAHEVPLAGGETEFADLRAAYDGLEQATREQIEDLVAEHSIFYSRRLIGYTEFSDEERAALPPVPQSIVRTHPSSGRRTLYLASHASHIIGWPEAQGRALLDELMTFATQPRFVYQHRWRAGDLVVWDNRCTLHRGRPYDDANLRRDMRRTTVEDSAPTLEQSRTLRDFRRVP